MVFVKPSKAKFPHTISSREHKTHSDFHLKTFKAFAISLFLLYPHDALHVVREDRMNVF